MLAARWQRHPSDAEEWKSLRYWPCGKQGPVCSVRALALLMLAAGCGLSTRPQNPEQVVGQYSDALRAGDARRAWSLLSEEARRAMPFELFRAELQRDPAAARRLADAVMRPSGPVTVTAVLVGADGDELHLVFEDGQWRLDADSIDPYPQATPRQALGSFVRAVRRRRFDVLLHLAPEADRKGLDAAKLARAIDVDQKAEVMAFVEALEAALPTAPVEILGNRATMGLGSGSTVQLVLEDGAWKIEDYLP